MSIVDSDSWIFINYAPGSFGSFLTKILELSPDVYGRKTTDIFNQYNASHNDITKWIRHFHDGDDLIQWSLLSYKEQRQYILDNVNTNLISATELKRIHRFTIPKHNHLYKKHFNHAKFVKITIDPTEIDFVVDMMSEKTLNDWITYKISDQLKKVILNIEYNKQREYYATICKEHIIGILDNSIEEDTFNFPVQAFFSLEQFDEQVENLISWLGIHPGNHQDLYNKFFLHHNKFNQI